MKYNQLFKRTVAMVMSVVLTVSMLPLSALAQDTPHTHSDDCYEDYLTCGVEAGAVHTHDDSCNTVENHTVCGLVETEGHTHTDECYQTENVLTCKQEETEGHTHSGDCWDKVRYLSCTDESKEHSHGDGCYDQRDELVCGQAEKDAHAHGEGCYESEKVLKCTQQVEPHTHEEKCWKEDSVLTCTESTEPHVHTDDCYDKKLVCEFADADPDDKTGDSEQGSGADAYTVMSGKISALPPVDAVAEMTDEEKQALVETLSALMEELDALLDEETITMEQYEALALPMMKLNEAIIGDTPDTLDLELKLYDKDAVGHPLTDGNRISNLMLYYRKDENDTWKEVTGGISLTGEEELQLVGNYYVAREDLAAAGGVFTYELAPYLDEFDVDARATNVSLRAVNGVATFTFDPDWETKLTNSVISGGFTMNGSMDARGFHGGDNVINLGGTEIHVTLPDDIKGKFSNVTVSKGAQKLYQPDMTGYSMEDSRYAGKSYILYSVQVTGDPNTSTDNVKVIDSITNSGTVVAVANGGGKTSVSFKDRYFDGYAGVTGTAQDISAVADVEGSQGTIQLTDSQTDSITWNVGTVGANETKWLTYKVVVDDNYVGFAHGKSGDGGSDADGGSFENKAEVYAGHYPRNEATDHYTPKGDLSVAKSANAPVFNAAKNQYEITYHLTASAPASNSYTMTDVKLFDVLEASGFNAETVVYDTESLKLWDAKGNDITSTIPDPSALDYRTVNPEVGARSLTVIIGDLKPGESKTLTYNAVVPVAVFLNYNTARGNLKNTAQIYDDEVKDPVRYGSKLGQAVVNHTLELKHWGGKLAGNVSDSPRTVNISGGTAFYDATSGSVVSTSEHPASFTVPAKNIQYRLVVNQTGDWDVSGAAIHDQLTQNTTEQVMRYAGWVRVNAYAISNANRANLSGNIYDSDAYNRLNALTPSETVWVKVEDLTSFSFSPSAIGLTTQNRAYTLEYYTYTKSQEFTKVNISNGFGLTGQVGIEGSYYTIGWGGASITKSVTGSVHFGYEKKAWYYDTETPDGFAKGQLYWFIKATSNTGEIHAGTQIKDAPEVGGDNKAHTIVNEKSVLGVYRSSTPVTNYTDYASFAAAAESLNGKYTTAYSGSGTGANAVITFTEDITLTGTENVYIIVRTAPSVIPNNESVSSMNYVNKAYAKHGTESNFDNGVSANQPIRTGYSMQKTANGVFRIAGGTVTPISTGASASTIVTSGITVNNQPFHYTDGIYISWQISLSDMAMGSYTVADTLPDGVELAYIRKVSGNAATGNSSKAGTTPITCVSGGNSAVYYTDGSDLRVYFPQIADKGTAVLQVVVRVVDPDILQGGVEKELVNHSSLYSGDTVDGIRLTSSAAPVTVVVETVSKGRGEADGTTVPFTLVANKDGLDLNPGGSTLTMVDKMAKSLRFNPESLVVKNASDVALTLDQDVSESTYKVEYDASGTDGNVLKITIPDNQKLTISYTCTVNALPGIPVSFSNVAYWEGHSDGSKEVKEENFVSQGSVSVDTHPEIRVLKLDNNLTKLSGAEFKLYKLTQTLNGDAKTITVTNTNLLEDNLVDTKSSGADGVISFLDEGKVLYDTVYALVETTAPEGYALDATPHYVVILKNHGNAVQPEFYSVVNDPGVVIESNNYVLNFTAYNSKGSVTVTKDFADANGAAAAPVPGTYTFGIWVDDGTHAAHGVPQDTRTITWAEGETAAKSVTFTDLDARYSYIICELDDTSNPINNNSVSSVNGTNYRVVYSQSNVVANFNSPATVHVSNREPGRASATIHAYKTLNNTPAGGFSLEVLDNNGTGDRSGIVVAVPERNVQGAVIITSAFDANGEVTLDLSNMVSFIKAGVYRYKVREIYDRTKGTTQNGVTYDSREYDVTITVTENSEGKLNAETRYTVNGAAVGAIRFANTYDATGVAEIKAIKHLSGRDWKDNDSFTFTLVATNNAPLRKVAPDGSTQEVTQLTETATKTHREMNFGSIGFTYADLQGYTDRTFYYRIDETGTYAGITAPAPRIVAIKVSDANHNGQLTVSYARYNQNGSLTNEYTQTQDAPDLINIYHAAPVTANIQAVKKIMDKNGTELTDWTTTGHDWSTTEFRFCLERTRNTTPMPAGTNGEYAYATVSNKTAVWEDIEFTAVGEYDYIIREMIVDGDYNGPVTTVHDKKDGLLYDVAVHSAKVIVSDDMNGHLTAQVVYYRGTSAQSGNAPIFYNRDLPDCFALLSVGKTLTGAKLRDGGFSFELYDSDANAVTGTKRGNASVLVTDAANNVGEVHFGAITYNWDDALQSGPMYHYYLIKEKTTDNSAMQNLTGDILVKVTVTGTVAADNSHIMAVESVTYFVQNSETQLWEMTTTPTIANQYTSSGAAVLTVSKHIEGRDFWTDADVFTFTLTDKDGLPVILATGETAQVTADKDHRIVSFPQLNFTQEDMNNQTSVDYVYTIHEEVPTDTKGMTYAANVDVTVRLTDDGQGHITAQYEVGNRGFTNVAMNAQFDNIYTVSPTHAELKVTKRLTGRDWLPTDTFSFEVVPISNTAGIALAQQPMPTNTTVSVTNQSTAVTGTTDSFTGSFGTITFAKPGIYQYDISEQIPVHPILGISYSTSVHRVTVTVTDNGDGTMSADVLYAGTNSSTPAAFTNTYAPVPVTLAIQGSKTMTGCALKADRYYFNLYETDNTYGVADGAEALHRGSAAAADMGASGAIDLPTLSFTEPGDYYYVLKEEVLSDIDTTGKTDGVTYDTHAAKIHVTVTDKLDGTMTAVAAYDNNGAPVAADAAQKTQAAFTNNYYADGTVDIRVTKQMLGWNYKPNTQFQFRLTPVDGAPIRVEETVEGVTQIVSKTELVTNATLNYEVAGFDSLHFTLADVGSVYKYTIAEVIPEGADTNNTHNGIVYNADPITVLVRVTDGGKGQLTFAVTYNDQNSATITNFLRVQVSGVKTWNDDGAAHNNAQEITLNLSRISAKAGAQKEDLTMVPVWNGNAYVFSNLAKFDDEGNEYTYTVTENRVNGYYNGVITTQTGTDGNQTFDITNTPYTAAGSVTLTATKVLTGGRDKDIQADEFSFVVRDAGGKTVSTGKNAADGSITFTPITYTQADLGEDLAPKTYTYTVSEVTGTDASITYSAEVYKVSVTVAPADASFDSAHDDAHKLTCTVTKADSADAAVDDMVFHNVYNTGSLKITKTVLGNLGSKTKEFTFTVTLSCEGEYAYTGSKTGTITSGGTVKLKHGESITIAGLPAGTEYTVTESDNAGYVVNATNAKGTIDKNKTVAAIFVNSKSSVPKTGDGSNFIQWVAAMVACLVGAAAALFFLLKRRSRYHN